MILKEKEVNEFLEHFGIKGMQWGRRNSNSSSKQKPSQKRYTPEERAALSTPAPGKKLTAAQKRYVAQKKRNRRNVAIIGGVVAIKLVQAYGPMVTSKFNRGVSSLIKSQNIKNAKNNRIKSDAKYDAQRVANMVRNGKQFTVHLIDANGERKLKGIFSTDVTRKYLNPGPAA